MTEACRTTTTFVSELVPIMLKAADMVMWIAPAGMLGAVASAITIQGSASSARLGQATVEANPC